jgi:uncharacterized protein involved in outer membrane biogenesis
MASDLPLDNLNAVLDLHGEHRCSARFQVQRTCRLDPGDGRPRKANPTKGEMTVRNVSSARPASSPPQGSAGKVGGQAHFVATGNSIADMLATSNGEAALISWGGEASELSIVLTNLDLARAAQLLLKGDENSPIRCIVADFVAEDGHMVAKTLVIDTDAEKILGEGSIDFAKERYDLTLNAQSKRPSLLALRGPIVVDGSFSSPQSPSRGRPDHSTRGELGRLGYAESAGGVAAPIDTGAARTPTAAD